MMKTILTAIALTFLTMITLHGGAVAQDYDTDTDYERVIDPDDDDDGADYSINEGPNCAWIAKQVRRIGSAYWKTRYFNDCLSTVDAD